MFISEITLRNWLRYRGERTVKLGASVYSVTARLDTNADRSNWLGKSSFLGSIPFALYGKHEKNTEDEWITNGENDGEVRVVLSNGVRIARSRHRGRTTVLVVERDGKSLKGKEAQDEIDRLIGLNASEFFAAAFVKQKRLDAFIKATSGQRMQMLRDWLDLERIEKAEDILAERLEKERRQEADLVRSIQGAKGACENILRKHFDFESLTEKDITDSIIEFDAMINEAKVAEHAVQVEIAEARNKLAAADKARDREAAQRNWQEYQDQLLAIGELPDIEVLRDRLQEANDAVTDSNRRLQAVTTLACGAFDGVCPIDGHACSDQAAMNAQRANNAALKRERETELGERTEILGAIRTEHAVAEKKRREYSNISSRADELMKRFELGRHVDAPTESPSDLKEELSKIEVRQRETVAATVQLERDKSTLTEVAGTMRELAEQLQKTTSRAQCLNHAVRIIGRTGLQRVLCERARSAVETRSNEMLAESGIDLKISLSWQREGKGYAKNCAECGAVFPSKTAKKCAHCGAERSANVINELDVNLSDRSGAAEDLAGCSIQMAAAQFLREQRGSEWATLCIDEPFGALDSQNRKDLARHLVGMVRGGMGFEQGFIVAHDRALMDALPSRVEVLATSNRSDVEVTT